MEPSKGGDDDAMVWKQRCERAESLRQEERRGRIAAEQRARELQQRLGELDTSTAPPLQGLPWSSGPTNHVQPIGCLQSCFRTRNGTPRQSGLVPHGRAVLRLTGLPRDMDGRDAVDGLQEYSHVWLLFLFHANTTSTVLKAKVTPPRLGLRTGLYATRTPHRPNALGLTLARLDRISHGEVGPGNTVALHLSGSDLVDGTPVLDVKGYLPHIDVAPDATMPAWVAHNAQRDIDEVALAPDAVASIEQHIAAGDLAPLYPPGDSSAYLALVREVLAYDIRSLHRKEGVQSDQLLHSVQLDALRLDYEVDLAARRVRVVVATHQL